MTEYAPNFRKAVINYQVLARRIWRPASGLTGGNIMQGTDVALQSFVHATSPRLRRLPYSNQGAITCVAPPPTLVVGSWERVGITLAREILKDG
jgi:hypothetical protein